MILFQRQVRTHAVGPSPDAMDPTLSRIELACPGQPDRVDTLHYRLDERSTLVRGPDWWVYAATPVGLDCFPALTSLLSPERDLKEILEGLEDLRLVAFAAGCQRHGSVHFGRAFDGVAALFFGHDDKRLVISDSRIDVARALGEVRLSRRDGEIWCRSLRLDPEGSFYEGVSRCFAGVRYDVACGRLEPDRRRFMAAESRVRDGADPVQILTEGLRALFATYGNRRVALRLSGGADSRVLLVGLMDAVRQGILNRDQVLCTSVLYPGLDCDETAAIARIVELSGFEWAGIEATKDSVQRAQRENLQLKAPPFPTSFMGALCGQEARRRGASLMLSGHGGDELFVCHLPDLLDRRLRTRMRNIRALWTLYSHSSWKSMVKGTVLLLAGRRRLLPHARDLRHAQSLPAGTLQAYRLERRLTLAQICGYGMAAEVDARDGLLTDMPFFRGPFFSEIDPAQLAWIGPPRSKRIAYAYMRAHAPDVATVACGKVPFDQAVHLYLGPRLPSNGQLDRGTVGRNTGANDYGEWSKIQLPTPS